MAEGAPEGGADRPRVDRVGVSPDLDAAELQLVHRLGEARREALVGGETARHEHHPVLDVHHPEELREAAGHRLVDALEDVRHRRVRGKISVVVNSGVGS